MPRWWRKGLLDPDTPMVDRAAMDARVAAGVVAVSNRYDVTCLTQRTLELGGGRPPCDAFRDAPDSKWLRFHAVTAPDGTYGLRHENRALPLSHPGQWFVVRHDVPDAKLARILQIYDWVNFNCEGRLLSQYGVDGEHYTRHGGTICSEDGVDFARDGFVRLTAAGAEQVATNAVGLDFYNHT